jgi:hypothetical protein
MLPKPRRLRVGLNKAYMKIRPTTICRSGGGMPFEVAAKRALFFEEVLEAEMDRVVYGLYRLGEAEILVVQGDRFAKDKIHF